MHDDSRVEINYISRNNPHLCCRNFSAVYSEFASATAKENEKFQIFNGCEYIRI